MQENEEKLQELVLFISQRCAHEATFGAVKLNKILYFADFLSYAKRGNPITGMEYQKLANAPAPRKLRSLRDQMIQDGSLVLLELPLSGGRTQKRTVNLRLPNVTIFTGDEIALVHYLIDALICKNAAYISDISHRTVGWQVAWVGETIPYDSVFLSDEPLSAFEIERGKQLAAVTAGCAAARSIVAINEFSRRCNELRGDCEILEDVFREVNLALARRPDLFPAVLETNLRRLRINGYSRTPDLNVWYSHDDDVVGLRFIEKVGDE